MVVLLFSAVLVPTGSVAAADESIVSFEGSGWGHGVGLCQVGAYGMALRGAAYREILAHYYTGSKLEPLESDER